MAKKAATRRPRAKKAATTKAKAPRVNRSELVRKYAAQHKGAKAAEIQKALAEQGVTLSLPGIYQALRKNGAVKKKRAVAAKASKNGHHHDEHGAVSRFIHAVGELGIETSESLFATIKKLTGRK